MSTKLYNAHKLPIMNLEEFFSLVERVKKAIKDIQVETYNKEFSEKCLKIYDFKTLYPNGNVVFNYASYQSNEGDMKISSIVSKMMEIGHKKHKQMDKMDSFYFHVHFLFHKNRIYAITRHLNDKMEKAFSDITKAKDFCYWNNTDRPSNVTEDEWKLREKEWNDVFGNSSWDVSQSKNGIKLHCEFEICFQQYEEVNPQKQCVLNKERTKYFSTEEVVSEEFLNKTYVEHDVFRFLTSDDFRDKTKEKNKEMFKKLEHDYSSIRLDTNVKVFKEKGEREGNCLDLNIELDLI